MRTVTMMTCQEWDQLIKDTYGKMYCLQQQDGCYERGVRHLDVPSEPNDHENTSVIEEVNGPEMGVSFAAWLARDPQEPLTMDKWQKVLWWERNFYPDVQMVANDLYAKGLLAKGSYVIEIDW